MKNKILQEFLNSDIKIKSKEKLEQYIDYCIKNNQKEKIKGKTSYHHVLPKSLFPLYSKLKDNLWNGSHLLYSDHYYAHWLLTEAIDDYSQLHAFVAMHNKDINNGRIEEKDLIPKDEFQEKMEMNNKNISMTNKNNSKDRALKRKETMKEIIEFEGKFISRQERNTIKTKRGMTEEVRKENGLKISEFIKNNKEEQKRRKDRMQGENNIIHKEGVKEKIKNTKSLIDEETGLNKFQSGALKASLTMKKEYIDDKGNKTSILKERLKKQDLIMNEEIIVDGKKTTKKKVAAKKAGKNRSLKHIYVVCSVFSDKTAYITRKESLKYNLNLKSSKEKYTGYLTPTKNLLINSGLGVENWAISNKTTS